MDPPPRSLAALLTLLTLASLLLLAPLAPPAAADPAAWRWPLGGTPTVIRGFAAPTDRWLAGHRGVDLATTVDARVASAGAGRVAFAGNVAGIGVVSVDHGRLRTTYLPVRARVRRGAPIAPGDPLGHVSSAPEHCGERPCLHWGLRRGYTYLDPLSLLGQGRVRLLPCLLASQRSTWGGAPTQRPPASCAARY